MEGESASGVEASPKDTKQSRQRSTIAFPYTDLDACMAMANAIHEHVGLGDCDDSQLAAWTDQSPKSSGFRVQLYAARGFGLLSGEAGQHKLTDLGKAIVDPNQVREAKAKAFLMVPLFKALYENYKGGVIPPAAALEREIVSLGVSEKQKGRARQVFERSAEEAGFFEHGRNRLVMPGLPLRDEKTAGDKKEANGNGNGSEGGGGGLDPLVRAIIDKLPKKGPWKVADRVMWFQMLAMACQMAYGPEPQIEIKVQDAE